MLGVDSDRKADCKSINILKDVQRFRTKVQETRNSTATKLICWRRISIGVEGYIETTVRLDHTQCVDSIRTDEGPATCRITKINRHGAGVLLSVGETNEVRKARHDFVALIEQVIGLLAA